MIAFKLQSQKSSKKAAKIVLCPNFGGEDTPNFGHAFPNLAHFRVYITKFGRVLLSALR